MSDQDLNERFNDLLTNLYTFSGGVNERLQQIENSLAALVEAKENTPDDKKSKIFDFVVVAGPAFEGQKIRAIKAIRKHLGLSLVDAKNVCDQIGEGGRAILQGTRAKMMNIIRLGYIEDVG